MQYLAGKHSNDSGIHNGTDESWLINSENDLIYLKVEHEELQHPSTSTLTDINPLQQKISNYSGEY